MLGGSILEPMKGFLLLGHFQKFHRFPALSLVFVVSWVGGNIFPQKIHPKPPKHHAILNRCHLQISVLFENLCCRQDPEHCQHGGW